MMRLEKLNDNDLYEALASECNHLHGMISKRMCAARIAGDDSGFHEWAKEYMRVSDQYDDVRYDDRAGQIALIRAWRKRAGELDGRE